MDCLRQVLRSQRRSRGQVSEQQAFICRVLSRSWLRVGAFTAVEDLAAERSWESILVADAQNVGFIGENKAIA